MHLAFISAVCKQICSHYLLAKFSPLSPRSWLQQQTIYCSSGAFAYESVDQVVHITIPLPIKPIRFQLMVITK